MAEKREQKRGLGRGLSALMADIETPMAGSATGGIPQRATRKLPIEKLVPNPDQPRRTFDEAQLQDLANSIRSKGIIQPLVVRPAKGSTDTYEIVAGERRWRAAQVANLHEVPVIERDLNDDEVLEIAIIENIQREDLNPIEEASGFRQLMHRFGHTQEKLAEALGKSRSHIANLLRLLNLPEEVQEHVQQGRLSAGHARALVTSPDAVKLAQEIINKGLSVRDTEKLVKKSESQETPKPRKKPSGSFQFEKDADTKALEADLSAALGMKVRIGHAPGQETGTVTISYDTLEQLDALCMILSANSGN